MTRPPTDAARRPDSVFQALLLVAGLSLYGATLARTVTMEDSGLFLMAARFLGPAHPPGFPLYTLLGHLSCLLPLGSVAERVHWLSAAATATAAVLLYRVARGEGLEPAGALAAGLLLLVSRAVWSQAVVAEVYALNLLLFVAQLHALQCFRRSGRPLALGWCGLLFGLGLSNHWPLFLLVAPAFLLLLLPRWRQALRGLWLAIPGLIAGLLPYGWMVLRSHQRPEYSFFGPIVSGAMFRAILERRAYLDLYSVRWEDRLWMLEFYGTELLGQLTGIGLAVALWGAWTQRRTASSSFAAALLAVLLALEVLLPLRAAMDWGPLARATHQAYPLPAYAMLALLAGSGLEALGRRLPQRVRAGGLWVLLPAALVGVLHFAGNDRRGDTLAADYGRAVLESIEPGGILFVDNEMDAGPIGYLHLVEGLRPDVRVLSHKGLFFRDALYPSFAPEKEKERLLQEFVAGSERPIHLIGGPPLPFGAKEHGLYRTVFREWPSGRTGYEPLPILDQYVARALSAGVEPDPFAAQQRDLMADHYGKLIAPVLATQTGDSRLYQRMEPLRTLLTANLRGLLSLMDAGLLRADPQVLWEWSELARSQVDRQRVHWRFRAWVLYLRGAILQRMGTPQSLEQAEQEVRRCLEIDDRPNIRELLASIVEARKGE